MRKTTKATKATTKTKTVTKRQAAKNTESSPSSPSRAFKPTAANIVHPTTYIKPLKVLVLAFNKHIQREFEERIGNMRFMDASVVEQSLLIGSEEQTAIWNALVNHDEHLVVEAVAGSGKTTTAIDGIKRLMLKHMGNVDVVVKTYHAHGMNAISTAARGMGRNVRVSEYMLDDWLRSAGVRDKDDWREVSNLVKRLVGIVKGSLVKDDDEETLVKLADHHELDTNGVFRAAVPYVWSFVKYTGAQIRGEIGFDDMPWLPVRLGLDLGTWDVVFVDEAQDTNPVQAAMVNQMVGKGARVIVLGDSKQAIYGFRGADVRAMGNLRDMLATTCEVKELGLTYTRRCGKKIVEIAQTVVPYIKALDSAGEGNVRYMAEDRGEDGKLIPRDEKALFKSATEEVGNGDMVLCRMNAPLISFAYGVLKRGMKCVIKGREIGNGLVAVVKDRLTGDTPSEFTESLQGWYKEEEEKLMRLGEKGVNKLAALGDKADCLWALVETIEKGKWIGQEGGTDSFKLKMVDRINGLFSDEAGSGVTCGTVHKMKGLEADKVWVLKPEVIPHPRAKGWQLGQEWNILYVAVTRAKRELVVVGGKFSTQKKEEGEE